MNVINMTKKEAIRIANKYGMTAKDVDFLESIGAVEFKEEKKEITTLLEINNHGFLNWCGEDIAKLVGNQYGTIRVAEWPEGLVLWVGGQIRWTSWEKYYKRDDIAQEAFRQGLIK